MALLWIALSLAVLAGLVYFVVDSFFYKRGLKFLYESESYPEDNGLLIIRIGTLASKVFPSGGIVLNQLIHLDSNKVSAYLVAHEWKHVLQQKEIGSWKFLFKYIFSSAFRKTVEDEAHDYGLERQTEPKFISVSNYLTNNVKTN